jgi:hypothetical protein
MTRNLSSIAAFALLVWSATLVGQNINTLTGQEKGQGWQLLFDGKTLKGWHSSPPPPPRGDGRGGRGRGGTAEPAAGRAAAPPPQPGALPQVGVAEPCVGAPKASATAVVPAGGSHWEVVDGLLIGCGEPPGYLTSDASYKNFVLSLEFRTGNDTNSGVFVRSPKEAGGYEVQIWRQQPAGYNTGSIVGTAKTARDFQIKPNAWNTFQITADGDHIVVVLNGETTLDIKDTRFSEGNIRLQYQQFPIAFRNIRIRTLP